MHNITRGEAEAHVTFLSLAAAPSHSVNSSLSCHWPRPHRVEVAQNQQLSLKMKISDLWSLCRCESVAAVSFRMCERSWFQIR